jgi:CRP/FNR family transcriptional regulator, anaerobic regulatory protein
MVLPLKDPLKRLSGFEPSPCAACTVRDWVFCSVLSEKELARLDDLATHLDVEAKATIINEGDEATHLFNVTEGLVKLYKLLPDGREQITGFLFAGDFLGIAMNDTYAYSAETTLPTKVCRFDRSSLEEMFREIPKLENRILNMATNELVQAQDQLLLLGRKTAKERLCSFLLSLSQRMEKRGDNPNLIPVPMSRESIADYLGLTTETVSRTFSKLKKENVISLNKGGIIDIHDLDNLVELAQDSS